MKQGAAASIGLVLEGGGMRAAYTAGVLDAFLDAGVDLPYVIGVSAGANAGSDYVAGQRERNHKVFVELAADRRYAGLANLVRERSWFGMRFLFETLPDELAPFDYEAFRHSAHAFTVGVTDCATGQPVYFRHHDHDPRWFGHTVLRASSSLPVLSPPVTIGGRPYLDGGVSDSIPIGRSIADGNRRNVVVLTRNAGFRKRAERLGPGRACCWPASPRSCGPCSSGTAATTPAWTASERWSRPARPSSSGPPARLSSAAWSATWPSSKPSTARATTRRASASRRSPPGWRRLRAPTTGQT